MSRTIEQRLVDYAIELDAVGDQHTVGDVVLSPEAPVADGSRRGESSGWRRVAAIGAAVAAVLVLVAVLAGDDRDVVRTDPADEPSDGPTGPADAPGFFSRQGTADEVVATYLSSRLDAPVSSLTIERLEPEEGQSSSLVGFGWTFAGSAPGGTVVLQQGPDDWWDVIDAFSDGLSIDSLSRAEGTLTVEYSGAPGTAMHLIVQDLGDSVLDAEDCSQGSCTFAADVPDIPIVVRLQRIGDRGQPVTLEERRIDPTPGGDAVTTSTAATPTTAIVE